MRTDSVNLHRYERLKGAREATYYARAYGWRGIEDAPTTNMVTVESSTSETPACLFKVGSHTTWFVRKIPSPASELWSEGHESERRDLLGLNLLTPFELVDSRKSDKKKLHELVASLRDIEDVSFRDELAGRILELEEIVEEEEPDFSISIDSFRWLITLIRQNRSLARPSVVLTEVGNFRAEWRAGPKKFLGVDFLPDGRVKLVAFAPDSRNPEVTVRLSGIATVENLLRFVEPMGVLRWVIVNG